MDETTNAHEARMLEYLFEHAPCGYLVLDPNGKIQRANGTFVGWMETSSSEIVGKRLTDLLNVAGRIYFETHFAPLIRMQGHFKEVALEFVSKSGARLSTLAAATGRRDESGTLKEILLTVFNSSDRRRYERELLDAKAAADAGAVQLRDLNATLEARITDEVGKRLTAEDAQRQMQKMESFGNLTGGIAHDFNNMLAVIVGALGLIERRQKKGQDISDLLTGAMDGATRAADLTKRLLAFARQLPLELQVVETNGLVSGLSEMLRRTLGEATPVETVLAGGLWPVQTDRGQLENVIVNLAVNARDAMPGGGKITIETANAHLDEVYARSHVDVSAGQYVMIAVSDTGTGMSEEVMAKAFDPFFTTKEIGRGTGLGLSQIFGYVKQVRGHVKIYSEVGHGTSVKVYLPRYYGPVETPADPAPSHPLPQSAHGEVVLVVDDDDRVRTVTAASLRELGYNVMSVASGAGALKMLEEHPDVAVLFTDIVMPVMNGRDLAAAALQLRPSLKVLFTTGYAKNSIINGGVLDYDADFLSKPFTLDQLARKMSAVLMAGRPRPSSR